MFTSQKILSAALVASVLTLAGCKDRFEADFEADAVGAAPAQYPASSADDEIFVLETGRGSARVTNSAPLSGSKSLRINGPGSVFSSDLYGATVYMYAEPLEYNETVYASWLGKLSAGAGASVMLTKGHFQPMVEVELRNNQFIVNGSVAGSYTAGQEHLVLITVGRNGRFSASISGTGATGSVSNQPLLSTFNSTSLQLIAQLLGGSSSSSYMMDDIGISEDEPEE